MRLPPQFHSFLFFFFFFYKSRYWNLQIMHIYTVRICGVVFFPDKHTVKALTFRTLVSPYSPSYHGQVRPLAPRSEVHQQLVCPAGVFLSKTASWNAKNARGGGRDVQSLPVDTLNVSSCIIHPVCWCVSSFLNVAEVSARPPGAPSKSWPPGPPHVSIGLGTMLFGVSGNCDDREVTSLPEELPREPDSEKDTCQDTHTQERSLDHKDLLKSWLFICVWLLIIHPCFFYFVLFCYFFFLRSWFAAQPSEETTLLKMSSCDCALGAKACTAARGSGWMWKWLQVSSF